MSLSDQKSSGIWSGKAVVDKYGHMQQEDLQKDWYCPNPPMTEIEGAKGLGGGVGLLG
jgi:hypothetical protein